jgi:hypothetical protein
MIGAMPDHPAKITFGEMRESGVRSIQIYCADYRCSHSINGLTMSGYPTSSRGSYARHAAREGPASSAMANRVRLDHPVCFSRIELTSHGSPARGLAADVVVLPLHTRY